MRDGGTNKIQKTKNKNFEKKKKKWNLYLK